MNRRTTLKSIAAAFVAPLASFLPKVGASKVTDNTSVDRYQDHPPVLVCDAKADPVYIVLNNPDWVPGYYEVYIRLRYDEGPWYVRTVWMWLNECKVPIPLGPNETTVQWVLIRQYKKPESRQ